MALVDEDPQELESLIEVLHVGRLTGMCPRRNHLQDVEHPDDPHVFGSEVLGPIHLRHLFSKVHRMDLPRFGRDLACLLGNERWWGWL